MSLTTSRTNAAPTATADPTEASPSAATATSGAFRDPIDPLTGMPEPASSAGAPLRRDQPAPLPNAKAQLPPYVLPLSGAGVLLGGLALLIGITVYLQLRRSHNKLNKQANDLKTELNSLAIEVGILRSSSSKPLGATEPQWRDWVSPVQPGGPEWSAEINRREAAVEDRPTMSQPETPQPIQILSNQDISKTMLTVALNNGDRQAMREYAAAQLNITSDSENAMAMGRSQQTQLEAVPGGGSYWLATIGDQAWLFPTELTLRGFLSAQPKKGLYNYEKQMIGKPELIEPALLRQEGNRWTVEALGRVAIP